MNGLDIAILSIFFISALIGALRGFTKEILSLFSWGGAIALSYIFLPLGREFVTPYIANSVMADGVALFCIFLISLILLSIIANILSGHIHESSYRGLDHSLGFGFGSIRGIVLICAAELFFSTFSPRHAQSPLIQSARFIPMVRHGADTLLQLLPASLRATILEQALKVEQQLTSKLQDQITRMPSQALGNEGLAALSTATPGQSNGSDNGQVSVYPQNGSNLPSQAVGQMPTMVAPPIRENSPQTAGQLPSSPPLQQQTQSQSAEAPHTLQQSSMSAAQMSTSQNQRSHYGERGISSPRSLGLGQSAMPQDTQTTVDNLSRLSPKSIPSSREDSEYTAGQRDDMNRLFQTANGE